MAYLAGEQARERKYGQCSAFIKQLQGHWEHPTWKLQVFSQVTPYMQEGEV